MKTRPLPLARARSGRSFSFLSLALALGALSACTGDGEPQPRPVLANPGMARLEVLGTPAEPGAELRFRCAADDPQGDPLTYQFDWGNDGDVTPAPQAVPSGTAVELAHVFQREGTFQARCRAVDTEGNEGPWSLGAGYTIQAPQPGEGRTEVNVEVFGRGRVTSSPARLSCPDNCRGWFDSDAEVTLIATPEAGWRFVGWWGAFCEGRGSASYTFTLTTPLRCVARFAPETESTADAWQRTGARLPASPVWSPDGTRLAALDSSLSVGSRLRIWDAASGKLVRAIRNSSDVFHVVAWSPRGDVVAVGLTGGGIALLDPATGRTVREWKGHSGSVRALAWSPDGRRLASGDNRDGLVRLWNADTGEPAGSSLSTAHMPQRLSWSPDGSRLAVEAGIRHSTTQWWVEVKHIALGSTEALWTEVSSFAWGPDGTRYAVGDEHEVRVYATATHALQATWSGTWGTVYALDWSPDGRWLGVADMVGPPVVLEAETGAEVARATIDEPTGREPRHYEVLRFHPSLSAFVAVEQFPGAVDLFTVDAAAHALSRREVLPHFSRVDAVAWSPAGDRLASAGDEGLVRLWDGQGLAVRALSGHDGKAIRGLSWDGAGARLASGGADGKACLWRAEDGALLRAIPHGTGSERQPIEVHRVALSPDGRRLATLSGLNPASALTATVRVWDVDSGAEVFRFPERSRSVRALTWTPDGRSVLAVSSDISWELWDSETGAVRLVDPGVESATQAAALSPDGTRLAIARQPGLSIHDLLTGEQRAAAHEGFDPHALAWSPDGRHIAGGGVGGLVFTWDDSAGLASTVVGFHEGNVSTVSWRPDGRALTTGGTDAAVSTWRFGAR